MNPLQCEQVFFLLTNEEDHLVKLKAVPNKSNEVNCVMQVDLEEAKYYQLNEEKKYSKLKDNFDDVRDADERQNAQMQVIYLVKNHEIIPEQYCNEVEPQSVFSQKCSESLQG